MNSIVSLFELAEKKQTERFEEIEKKGDGEILGSRGEGDGGETRVSKEGGDQETRASRGVVEGPKSAEKKQTERSEEMEKKGNGVIPESRGEGDGEETRASREGGDQETRACRGGVEGPESVEKQMERSEETEKKGDGEIPGSRGVGDGRETRASKEGGDQEIRASRGDVEGPESVEKKQTERSEQTEKKLMEQAEDEASSSSWMQMVRSNFPREFHHKESPIASQKKMYFMKNSSANSHHFFSRFEKMINFPFHGRKVKVDESTGTEEEVKVDESTGIEEVMQQQQHGCRSCVVEIEKITVHTDEASSSSWMQMVAEAKMLEKALRAIEMWSAEQEGKLKLLEESALAEEQVGSSSKLPGKPAPTLSEDPGSSLPKMADLMKDKESIGVDDRDEHGCSSPSPVVETICNDMAVAPKKRILDDMERWMRPSIYRVPDWLKCMTKAEAYTPQVVSLGPFHHDEPSLRPMEEHKRRLMQRMVERSEKPLKTFFDAITEVADQLQDAYDGLDENWRGEEKTARFVEVMVTDGGFLLEFMTTVTRTGVLRAGYAPYDPIFSERSLLSLWAHIRSDMILVENQVPLLALKTLEAVRNGTSPSDADINELVTDFICVNLKEIKNQENLGLHPLQMLHRKFCGGIFQPLKHQDELETSETSETTMLSAEELREAGVQFKRSKTRSVQDMDFKNGELSMPLVEIDDSAERKFFNLMAFERLHSTAGSVATDYMIFMDNIIDSERDVALLRSKGVLINFLSSDKAAADLFNSLGKGAALSPGSKVGHVQWLVAKHCKKPWPKLQASFKHTYLRNPWVFFSAAAAIILLGLTILQAIYTAMPFYTKN